VFVLISLPLKYAMKQLFILLLLCYSFCANGQLHDAQWVFSELPSVMDFRTPDTVKNYSLSGIFPMFLASANICDEDGNLLFITNGINVYDRDGVELENGSDIVNTPEVQQYQNVGLCWPQVVLFLPMPGNSRFYYLIHFGIDNNSTPRKIFYTKIDKEGNFGKGTVVEKSSIIWQNIEMRGGGMTACKHANGRDWWVIVGLHNTNTFMKFLVTPQGIYDPVFQSIGAVYNGPFDIGYSCFSLDGSKFATSCWRGKITLMDFDRCNGEFSNPILIQNNSGYNPQVDTISGCQGVAFSPSGRYLYAFMRFRGTQYDTWSNNIQDSIQIALTEDSSDQYEFSRTGLAPNGKIYVSTWSGGLSALHVINDPSRFGDSCNFVYGGQPILTVNSVNLPNMINYKLGALIGSGCDTLPPNGINDIDKQSLLNIQPNPANKYVYVEVGKPGTYTITLHDITGKQLLQAQTPQVTIFDTENLPAGTYLINISNTQTGALVESRRVVVQH
jgi:hypothetical protein